MSVVRKFSAVATTNHTNGTNEEQSGLTWNMTRLWREPQPSFPIRVIRAIRGWLFRPLLVPDRQECPCCVWLWPTAALGPSPLRGSLLPPLNVIDRFVSKCFGPETDRLGLF